MSEEYKIKLKLLIDNGDIKESDFRAAVWEATQEIWWADIKERIRHDLGITQKVYSLGRSGGYLTLDRIRKDYVEDLVEACNSACVNCQRDNTQHPGGKCLYLFTAWKTADSAAWDTLIELEVCVDMVNAAMKKEYLHELLLAEAYAYLDYKWESYDTTRSSKIDAG